MITLTMVKQKIHFQKINYLRVVIIIFSIIFFSENSSMSEQAEEVWNLLLLQQHFGLLEESQGHVEESGLEIKNYKLPIRFIDL